MYFFAQNTAVRRCKKHFSPKKCVFNFRPVHDGIHFNNSPSVFQTLSQAPSHLEFNTDQHFPLLSVPSLPVMQWGHTKAVCPPDGQRWPEARHTVHYVLGWWTQQCAGSRHPVSWSGSSLWPSLWCQTLLGFRHFKARIKVRISASTVLLVQSHCTLKV